MPSKLGLHINHVTDARAMRDFILEARPAVVKTLHHDRAFWQEIKAQAPGVFLLGRHYFARQPLEDPVVAAAFAADFILSEPTAHVMDAWEGYNEIPASLLHPYLQFERELCRILHGEGLRYVAGSWSVGVPDIRAWTQSSMRDLLRDADFIGVHEYCAPTMQDPRGGGWFTGRYRRWYSTLPEECRKPLIISECGIDSGAAHWDPGAQGGWQSFTDARDYARQLAEYDSALQQDDYVKGACIFCWGTLDPTWSTYDFTPELARLVRENLMAGPVGPDQPGPPATWIDVRDQLPSRPAGIVRRDVAGVDTAVIHHTDAPPTVGPQAIAAYHVHDRGWPCIAYHFCVGPAGEVWWTNDLDVRAPHARSHNDHTVGIGLLGSFMEGRVPTGPQLEATRNLLRELRAHLPNLVITLPHGELSSTACPGDTWSEWRYRLLGDDGHHGLKEVDRLRDLLARVEALARQR